MSPLEERTHFFLPSISLLGAHASKQVQLSSEQPISSNLSESHLLNSSNTPTNNAICKIKSLKFFNYIDLDFRVAPLSRELNAEVIAQLAFVIKVFIKEMNNILQAVYTSNECNETPVKQPAPLTKQPAHISTQSHIYYTLKLQVGKISFTGITPTNTALSLYTGDDTLLNLTNKNYLAHSDTVTHVFEQTTEFTLKPSIDAQCNISVELKTSVAATFYDSGHNINSSDEISTNSSSSRSSSEKSKSTVKSSQNKAPTKSKPTNDEWFQLAYFNTKFDLRNSIKASDQGFDRGSIMITVEKPRFYLQPGSIDSAILFWLNYKSTYEYWLQQRQQISSFLVDKGGDDEPLFMGSSPNDNPVRASKDPPVEEECSFGNLKSINNFLVLQLRLVLFTNIKLFLLVH